MSTTIDKEESLFLRDVSKHELMVEIVQGVHRSLLFRNPRSCNHYFRITTWPGHLCISGDMGTYVFERTEDMLSFFRMDNSDFNYSPSKQLNVNPGYWKEKLVSEDKQVPSTKFSAELFNQFVKEEFDSYCYGRLLAQEDIDACWSAIGDGLLDPASDEDARERITQSYWANGELQESFNDYLGSDLWERNWDDYSSHYLWCLRAIVWGIQQYDKFKDKKHPDHDYEIVTHDDYLNHPDFQR